MINIDIIRSWLETAQHKPYCQKNIDNFYSSSGECNCGLDETRKEFNKLIEFIKSVTSPKQ